MCVVPIDCLNDWLLTAGTMVAVKNVSVITRPPQHVSHVGCDDLLTDLKDWLMTAGTTTACDMGAVQDAEDAWDTLHNVYIPAADQGTLPMRLMAMVPLPIW